MIVWSQLSVHICQTNKCLAKCFVVLIWFFPLFSFRRSPISVAAAAIYMASQASVEKRSQKGFWYIIFCVCFSIPSKFRGGSRGRVQGVCTLSEMTCGFLIQLIFCKNKKKTMWFIGVEVEQETSAPLPKKKNLDPPPKLGFASYGLVHLLLYLWNLFRNINSSIDFLCTVS